MIKSPTIFLNNNAYIKKVICFFSNLFFSSIKLLPAPRRTSNKIIVVALSKIGDTVFIVPAVKALKLFYNDITIFCYEYSKNIFEIVFDDMNYVVVNREEVIVKNRIITKKYRDKLKELNPSKIFDFTGYILSASLIFNSKVKNIIGFNDDYFRTIYSKFLIKRTTPHLMDMYLDVVRAENNFNMEIISKEFNISFNNSDKILIHPYAGWAAKEWNFSKYMELTEFLQNDFNCSWIFPKENVNQETTSLLKSNNIPFIITNDIIELINEVKQSSVMISNDSGPIYIASILGKPTFTIYGPTNPIYSRPYGEYHRVIQKNISCSPQVDKQYCYLVGGKFCPSYECMNLLNVKEVYNKVISFLDFLRIDRKESVA